MPDLVDDCVVFLVVAADDGAECWPGDEQRAAQDEQVAFERTVA
jgi:hypothetical protein